jgi:hypothetical protein
MGYTIKIGRVQKEYELEDKIVRLRVKLENSPDAPAFGEDTDRENQRWPSYTAWNDSLREFGLLDLFMNKTNGLMRKHPGCFGFDKSHVKIVEEKYREFKKENPNIVAGFFEGKEKESYMARIEWLLFWMKKAVKENGKGFIENT